MKIVKKIKLWLERDENGKILNKGSSLLFGDVWHGKSFSFMKAYDISGEMRAMSELVYQESRSPKSSIFFDPNRSRYYNDPEYQFRTYPPRDVPAEVEDSEEYNELIKKAYIPLKIPQGTKEITLSLCEGDWINIEAFYDEEYVIIDDDGNEIPLECLVQDYRRKKDVNST